MAEKDKSVPVIPDKLINEQSAIGQDMYDTQRNGSPRQFPVQYNPAKEAIMTALLGLRAGTAAAAESSKFGSNEVGLLAGLGAGATVPGTLDEIKRQQLEMMAVDDVSPALVQAYPMLKGVPLGVVNRIAPFIQIGEKAKSAQALIQSNASIKNEMMRASPALRQFLEASMGIPEGSLGTLKSTEVSALASSPKTLTAEQQKAKENAQDGINSLEEAIQLFDKSSDQTKKLAAVGGVTGKAARYFDEDAQRLNLLISKATDVITRQRTGAALNENEQKFYSGLVNDVLRSNGQNRQSMIDLLNFYKQVNAEIESGQRSSKYSLNPQLSAFYGAKSNGTPGGDPHNIREKKSDPLGIR